MKVKQIDSYMSFRIVADIQKAFSKYSILLLSRVFLLFLFFLLLLYIHMYGEMSE